MRDQELKRVNEQLKLCKMVEEVVTLSGWKEVIEPLIDKSILDVTGGKVDGRWYGGLLDRARKDERREYYVGYKQALIDFHRRVMAYVEGIKVLDSKREGLLGEKSPKYTLPLVDDTKYGRV